MELVPSAVGPNTIKQRCRYAKVRTLQKVWSPEARNPFLVLWGLEIPKRTRPEGPLRSRPEGQKSDGSARSIIRKRQRADCTCGAVHNIGERIAGASDTRLCNAVKSNAPALVTEEK